MGETERRRNGEGTARWYARPTKKAAGSPLLAFARICSHYNGEFYVPKRSAPTGRFGFVRFRPVSPGFARFFMAGRKEGRCDTEV
jgi:hypothetical protein